jgi:hypothetical protein
VKQGLELPKDLRNGHLGVERGVNLKPAAAEVRMSSQPMIVAALHFINRPNEEAS